MTAGKTAKRSLKKDTSMPQLEAGGEATNDTVVAAEPTLEDRFAALGIEQDEKEDEPEPSGDVPSDTEAEPDLSEVEIDDADLPAIEPPVSLNAEEKEAFKTWPREAQEAISRRVGELEKGLHAKAQEAKTTQTKAEQAANERIAQMQQVQLETLQALLPQIPQRPDYRLQAQNPQAWAEAMEAHEGAIAQHRYVQQVAAQIEAKQQEAEQTAQAQQDAHNKEILSEKFPEFYSDKGPELAKGLKSTALAMGYTEDRLVHADAHDILAMKQASEWKAKADKFDTLMAKQMQRVRDGKKLPAISKPGTATAPGAVSAQRYAADRQAMRGGDKDAAARVFSKFL